MVITGKLSETKTRETEFSGEVKVVMTLDRPQERKVQVTLSNRAVLNVTGDEYDSLSARWQTDDDLLRFVAAQHGLTVAG